MLPLKNEDTIFAGVFSPQYLLEFTAMPVITFASPKGGAGKTTAALLLATTLALKGFKVTVIDADEEKWIKRWSNLPDKPRKLEVVSDLTEDTILDAIDHAKKLSQFVIVDLEGTANMMVALAISRSDFVLVPVKASAMDAEAGAKATKLIRKHEHAFQVNIPFKVFLTETSATIIPKTQLIIEEQLRQADIPVLSVQLINRDAFKQLFSYGGSLETLDPNTYKLEDAIINAKAFTGEILDAMKQLAPVKQTRKTKEVA